MLLSVNLCFKPYVDIFTLILADCFICSGKLIGSCLYSFMIASKKV